MIERRVVSVLIVNREGRVLMQHRAASAAVSANQWSLPGGKIESGELPVDTVRREMMEEAGITLTEVVPVDVRTRPSVTTADALIEVHMFCAATDAVQDDVVLGEGQAMVFMSPDEALDLDLGVTARVVLAPLLASPEYARLRGHNGHSRS